MVGHVLITGASGLLGRAIYREFKAAADWEVLGLAFSRTDGGLTKVDITNKDDITKTIADFKPDIIIHSAANRNVDIIEKDPVGARKTNVDATRYICEAAGTVNAWVLYISTDYVFDGKAPPYAVDAKPNPLNSYGESKLAGEVVTLEVNKGNGILRVPILYGEIQRLNESAITVLFDKIKDASSQAKMCNYQRRYPTHCDDVAFVIRGLAEKRLQDSSLAGVFHFSNDEMLTKYDMAVVMVQTCNLPTEHLVPDSTAGGANRPYDAHLDCSRVEQLGIVRRTKFQDGIGPVLKPFLN